MTTMARIVVIGDLMTDTVAHATLPLARGSDTPAKVTTHGGGSGANVAAWLRADGADVAVIGRRGGGLAGREPGHGADGLRSRRAARDGPGADDRNLRGDGDAQGRAHDAV